MVLMPLRVGMAELAFDSDEHGRTSDSKRESLDQHRGAADHGRAHRFRDRAPALLVVRLPGGSVFSRPAAHQSCGPEGPWVVGVADQAVSSVRRVLVRLMPELDQAEHAIQQRIEQKVLVGERRCRVVVKLKPGNVAVRSVGFSMSAWQYSIASCPMAAWCDDRYASSDGTAGSDCRTSSTAARTPASFWFTPVRVAIDALISSNVRTPIADAGRQVRRRRRHGGGGRLTYSRRACRTSGRTRPRRDPSRAARRCPRFSSVCPVSGRVPGARDLRVEVRERLADARLGAVQADAHAADVEAAGCAVPSKLMKNGLRNR